MGNVLSGPVRDKGIFDQKRTLLFMFLSFSLRPHFNIAVVAVVYMSLLARPSVDLSTFTVSKHFSACLTPSA